MRTSQLALSTLREAPAEAELVSHQLMLRAGLIKRLGSGLYSWMPLGLRVLRKVEHIVREEMNSAGALEILMPAIQPAELWQESGRWEQFGPQMLKIKDRHERSFCFGPTHEEVITDIARREIRSYKQLPLNFYQIQTKFRDEIRPRFGVMRAREFIMKDAYSFHTNLSSLHSTYHVMYEAYSNIFTKLGLHFRAVAADTGAIGGDGSHEFHVLADSGEDALAFCPDSDYAANVELASAAFPSAPRPPAQQTLTFIDTPTQKTCEAVADLLSITIDKTVKTLALMTEDNQCIAVLLRGDHQLNEIKLAKLLGLATHRMASESEIQQNFGCDSGFLGPVNVPRSVRIIADRDVAVMADFVCGANRMYTHLQGVNFGRDLPEPEVADIRNVVEGDLSPDGKGHLKICRGIEVGHIFQLRTKYAESMKCVFLDEQGKTQFTEMGCYGIGISRIVAAAIEQNHDTKGIIWPENMAPFQLTIVTIGANRHPHVQTTAEQIYSQVKALGIDVLLDDRDERPGVKFADIELIGIPHRLVIGERTLAEGQLEYQGRRDTEATKLNISEIESFLTQRLCHTAMPNKCKRI